MKKFLIAILMLFSFSVFAEKYTVLAIHGRAQNQMGAISVGQELDDEEVISVLGFSDNIKLDGNKYIFGPFKNKKVKDVISGPKLKKGKVVKASDVAPATEKSRPGVATAASRASDAKEDLEWDE